jgi:NAD(P)-dependent dehydrogenase (short-subunit alcohol dehydrogenase family)
MKAFNIVDTGKGLESWRRVELPDPTPGPGQVLNAVSPGPIESPILSKIGMPREAADQVYPQMKESVPMKPIGLVEEVAKGVAFLAIDATYTTETEIPVDGGWSQL